MAKFEGHFLLERNENMDEYFSKVGKCQLLTKNTQNLLPSVAFSIFVFLLEQINFVFVSLSL